MDWINVLFALATKPRRVNAFVPRHYLGRLEPSSAKIEGLNENERDKLY